MYLLDSDHLSIIQKRSLPELTHIEQRRSRHAPSDFFVSIVSFHEQMLGWHAYLQRAKNIQGVIHAYQMFEHIAADFSAMQIAFFDRAAADRFLQLRRQRVRIATMDLRIAATALARGFVLLSRNLVDFNKVPGLQVEDWTTPGSATHNPASSA